MASNRLRWEISITGVALLLVAGAVYWHQTYGGGWSDRYEGTQDKAIRSAEILEGLYGEMADPLADKIEPLHGKTIEQVVEELGQQNLTLSFTMSHCCCGEFRIELFNTYPPGRFGNANVEIKELWWKYPDYTLVVWFHQAGGKWMALDSCRWRKGVEF